MNFFASVSIPERRNETAWWFVFRKDDILVIDINETVPGIPKLKDLSEVGLRPLRTQYLGVLDEIHCFSAEVEEDSAVPEGMNFRSMRSLLGVLDDEMFSLVGRAFQVVDWDRNHQYCGRCGNLTETKSNERAKVCPVCGLINYPRISPAVIVAVIRDGKILLANAGRFRTKMYSVLAGFVETGETFEECVQREIKEEVNIEVKNIKYFGSQPWPFPNSIMVGFTAEYASGEIKVDGEEILDAGWYRPEEIPAIPGKWSIARKLIDWFIEMNR